jgi:hypothetical protein
MTWRDDMELLSEQPFCAWCGGTCECDEDPLGDGSDFGVTGEWWGTPPTTDKPEQEG